ncbi:2,5-diketo-D-gluconate reductase A [Zymomonas mobilis subsp. mobilis ZM4 = ATCC 31821]|uniref:Aldo/keto reductase n=2 Tax=Zymomonas mobilis TaxID=542 RepID=Q5NMU2_ZYMMO|nr:aldo/keto reductase [Zymomonas mobilis subsp. mobilis ZM4 = ATCC 31821]AVZ26208.1 2,5-diketo-D-gluconate reductase A [Zymomonas mobilis subsp. mobilis]AVZ28095.1 2,5-diketo-D-gluconate reductase A [Zymomonas mobilis subsp. mobilis]AVZ42540.1 2,5-diketo-D-gluconate reductase A [Zymomonas mobilis subsp. mobilis ZM4 = ATCC 31821]HCE37740.1 aldo/keto reductase [Zymomonas mobilis]
MSPISIPSIRLNDGNDLPAVGFGTYKLNGSAGVSDIVSAIKVGYRLLDSAFNYENEGAVGEAVREAGIARDKLRIVSKLPGRHHHFEEAIATVEESLYRAQLDYYDLYLIHWPNPSKDLYVEAWQALIEARKKGLIRSIGVCNFLPEHLERLIKETGVTPVVNQVELHPYFPQEEQRAWDKAHGIVTESWSPLGRASKLLQDDTIKKIADRLGKSIPQVILRWHVQLGAIPIPKASSKERQIENLSLFDFELSPQDVEIIATLARPDGRLADQDPARYEEF